MLKLGMLMQNSHIYESYRYIYVTFETETAYIQMKKVIFTIIPSLCFSLLASAQIELSGHQDVYYGTAAKEVPNTDGNFCWGLLCIAWLPGSYNATSEVVYMEPGEVNNSFKAKYRHHGNAGASVFRYCFYEVNGAVPQVCHTVTYAVDVEVNVNDLSAVGGEMQVFPNPIEHVGTVSYRFNQAPNKGKMVIYNTVGAKVKEIALKNQQGVIYVGGEEFASGVYFCSIEDNGVVHKTARIVFQ
jgi:hypothetical protein